MTTGRIHAIDKQLAGVSGYTETMNANISRLRRLRALSQRELAARARLSVTTVNRIESTQRKPIPRTVRKLAQALGVTLSLNST
jgi:transcriptional regulator with XRE-family HTH domain